MDIDPRSRHKYDLKMRVVNVKILFYTNGTHLLVSTENFQGLRAKVVKLIMSLTKML